MRYLATIGMVLTLMTSMSSPNSSPDTTLHNISSIANIVYAGLTIVIVIIAIWSLALTRKQMRENKKQSDASLAASAKQSQAAIYAVHEQIEASKLQSQAAIYAVHEQIQASEQQSKAAIDAIYKQIEASEKQAQEAIHNQHKPVVVPTSEVEPIPINNPSHSNMYQLKLNLENAGLGIALNVWGTLSLLDSSKYFCSVQTSFLIPHKNEPVGFEQPELAFPYTVFDGLDVFPALRSGYDTRLMLTYNDVFDNKYLAVFDKSPEFGWKQVTLRKVKRTMYELAEEFSLRKQGLEELFPPGGRVNR